MTHTAQCHCGSLTVEVNGEPTKTMMCHCDACRRRTGSSYNLGAWFSTADIKVSGETRQYRRTGDLGSTVTYYFCPTCGSNVYWDCPELLPNEVGIAVGCFGNPEFSRPTTSLYGRNKFPWVVIPDGIPRYAGTFTEDPE